ncbi:AMP-dependent synthetase/ligase [Macrophomina phaseolina MS6]|uniref:AMP-dependent synthetase/ligase n=1 Tax=Macrophomina phaseolina (strain MS6) TaxID=1126212 RepID=K2QYA2_MACPH|nr:AMP-dependent synthetase/ligase [Macrophomina phaseolina MS6]
MDTNYFICTLGQAAALDREEPKFNNINEFIDHQAEGVGDKPAVGFFEPSKDRKSPWKRHVLDFSSLRKGSLSAANLLSRKFGEKLRQRQTVGLLCPSSPTFLFAWLGLMRLGHAVLLIAPQSQPSAIAHLCMECQVSILLSDYPDKDLKSPEHQSRNTKTSSAQHPACSIFHLSDILPTDILHTISSSATPQPTIPTAHNPTQTDTAYLHHTSGTSSGLPKPIPQSHRAAVRVLPHLPTSPPKATFTTTPLYHGGIADCFRAWASDAPAWLFPGHALPITAANVNACLRTVQQAGERVAYFASVPYVLQLMAADAEAMQNLRGMELVGVGGAALPAEAGDRLAKTNREDGSFATADLVVPHPEIENAWKYHSRADSQLTLITGKKFDPAPLEAAIGASPFLDDALIFGSGRPFPGALLFRSKDFDTTSEQELIDSVKPLIEQLNEESQDHARIPRNMLIPMPHDPSALEKSSKGTVMRGSAEDKYRDQIEHAYSKLSTGDGSKLPDDEVPRFITDLVESTVSKSKAPAENDDLFAFGVDSIACMQIRHGLRQLLPKTSPELPLSVVEDCGTVKRLNEFVIKLRHGESFADDEDEHDLMFKLAEKYSKFEESSANKQTAHGTTTRTEAPEVVVLTGATGALGAHILHNYRRSDTTSKVYCLVRGADEHAAKERVNKALSQKGLPVLNSSHPGNSKVAVLQAQLGQPDLGLSAATYEKVAAEATIIMHVAWSVNFRMRLRSFEKDNIAGG